MNYLAHSVISLEIDEKTNKNTLYGNFTGDFYKGRIEKIDLQENLKSGIILHRLIDKISDRKENFLNEFLQEKFGIFKGANHRFATLGHDPILGFIFGTANILTNTITTVQIPLVSTYHVKYNEIYGNPQITELASTVLMLSKVGERIKEDKIAVALALIKQVIHIGTDLYTPKGIQIPGANLVLSKKNAENLTKYVSTGNIIKVTFSAIITMVINFIISILHNLLYDETNDISRELYNVRTQKILKVSNIIAESLNIAYVGANVGIGMYTRNTALIKEGVKKIDLGGYIVAVHQIVKSSLVQEKIRREYLENKLYDKFLGENYSFLEEE